MLLHTVGSFRRRALDPRFAEWPVGTVFTRDDVSIVGQSLVGAARAVGTPLVRVGERPVPSREGRYCCVVVTRIEAVIAAESGVGDEVWLDAELDEDAVVRGSALLLGRPGMRMRRPYVVRPALRPGDLRIALPGDVAEGDLVALACRRPVALQDIRRRAYHPERLSG
ncbi:hypothetical protein ACFJGV_14675 [Cnuibacter sp. UC19_7]|uniref:hypothetical protein n=1 Tax=Cnuibacter sp. UC19_7 TaxID=3350166 RepID=UPI00366B06F6